MASTRFDGEREEMIELLKTRGITDELLIAAMRKVDRHAFVTEVFFNKAYDDSALPIACQQTISQPYTVACMTQELHVKAGSKILEIGTGSGYQAAVLAEMGARVFTIERHMDLHTGARKKFESMGYSIVSKGGDGTIGWKDFAPYDGIIVTAGAPAAPEPLLQQLKDGGIMVVPVGNLDTQDLHVIRRTGDTFQTRLITGFKFVPLIGKVGWSKES